ncbi:hypothetical protein [Saccharopolyspora sp. NPDC049357]|uniref:hypothetical protein n=1 Tax=Saccharopolyspora sp. NPDC049357 TaxID=3154507 RepID=UPI0034489A51
MPSQLATAVADQKTFGSFLDILVHDFLPVFALAAGLMAVIWIACATIMISGYLIGVRLSSACAHWPTRACGTSVAEEESSTPSSSPSTPTAPTPKVVNLDRYRRRHQHRRSCGCQSDGTAPPRCDDDPA